MMEESGCIRSSGAARGDHGVAATADSDDEDDDSYGERTEDEYVDIEVSDTCRPVIRDLVEGTRRQACRISNGNPSNNTRESRSSGSSGGMAPARLYYFRFRDRILAGRASGAERGGPGVAVADILPEWHF